MNRCYAEKSTGFMSGDKEGHIVLFQKLLKFPLFCLGFIGRMSTSFIYI